MGSNIGLEFRVKRVKDLVQDKGGKDGAERAASGEAFLLGKVVPLMIVINIPADICSTVNEVKEKEERWELMAAW